MEDWKLAKQNIWLNAPLGAHDSTNLRQFLEASGAKFQAKRKSWFIPAGTDPLPLHFLWGPLRKVFGQDRKAVKELGATLDPNMERYIAPEAPLDFIRFIDYWPRDLRKFLFNDRFLATEQISGGGQAEILKATDTQTDEEVAVKLYVGAETSDEVLAAFSREHSLLHDTLNGCGGALRIVDYGRHSQSKGLFLVTPWMPATLDTFMNLSKTEKS